MRKDRRRSGVRVKTEIWAAMLELPSNVTQIRQGGSLATAVPEERTAALEQHRRNMDAFAFAQWRTALEGRPALRPLAAPAAPPGIQAIGTARGNIRIFDSPFRTPGCDCRAAGAGPCIKRTPERTEIGAPDSG
jgi:hypothetical protein